ncbi:MAG: fasciclin protein [Sphingobacteriales bacterium]|nr:fasciclin protein [Sphingobacteriales bacterium]
MKRYIQKLPVALLAGLFIVLTYSCKKQDEYYSKPAYLQEGSILDVLGKNTEYSDFTRLLKKSGYDSLLLRNDLYTVLAIRNGAFTEVDTTNTLLVKRIIGAHILSSALYRQNMDNATILSVSGKPLQFSQLTSGEAVNGLPIAMLSKTINGPIYEIASVIIPQLNLMESIAANADLSTYYNYITGSYKNIPDPLKNTILSLTPGTLAPVYKAPIIYMPFSQYVADTKINNESTVSTVFAPNDGAVTTVLSRMLAARSNKPNLIVPKIGTAHSDTTVGGIFLARNVAYEGDSSILRKYLYNNLIVKGNKTIAAGTNNFTGIIGNPVTILSAQVTGSAAASNGTLYFLNDVTLPAEVYRSRFMFAPVKRVVTNGITTNVYDPNIAFTGGANISLGETATAAPSVLNSGALITRFSLSRAGATVTFTLPFVTSGSYKVLLKNNLINNGAIISANYGSQLLLQNFNSSNQYVHNSTEAVVDVNLGNINVAADGPVPITFTCTGVSPKTAGQYQFGVDVLILIPVAP